MKTKELHSLISFTDTDSEEEDDSNDNLMFTNEKDHQEQKKKGSGPQQSQISVSLFAAHGVLDVFPHARVGFEDYLRVFFDFFFQLLELF